MTHTPYYIVVAQWQGTLVAAAQGGDWTSVIGTAPPLSEAQKEDAVRECQRLGIPYDVVLSTPSLKLRRVGGTAPLFIASQGAWDVN